MKTFVLGPTDSLVRIHREYKTRKAGAYLAFDKYGHMIIVTQKLPELAAFLNSFAKDNSDRVSVPALHAVVGKGEGHRTCGFTKHRWKVAFCPLESAAEQFESFRGGYERAVIVGAPAAYCVQ